MLSPEFFGMHNEYEEIRYNRSGSEPDVHDPYYNPDPYNPNPYNSNP